MIAVAAASAGPVVSDVVPAVALAGGAAAAAADDDALSRAVATTIDRGASDASSHAAERPVAQAHAQAHDAAPGRGAVSNAVANAVPNPTGADADHASAVPAERVSEPSGATETRTRPVNPYLNNTPELRARRLARALVSDLVAYNPQKREQGLRDGTLRQLFREEIRKSWDEYVEQVGATVAESTPHFQDALNDVLAGGRRVF